MTRSRQITLPGPPPHVETSEHLKAETVNRIIDSIGSRKIRFQKSVYQPPIPYRAFFDIHNINDSNVVKLQDNQSLDVSVWHGGAKQQIIGLGGNGVIYFGGRWQTDSIAADRYVYLVTDRSLNTVHIHLGATLPNGNENADTIPLWFFPWDSTNSKIDIPGIIDMRHAYILPAIWHPEP